MTFHVELSGASDDCIEVGGDLSLEWYFPPEKGTETEGDPSALVAFSDGTVLKITFDGVWRIRQIEEGTASYHNAPCSGERDAEVYSDVVTLTSDVPFTWAGTLWDFGS